MTSQTIDSVLNQVVSQLWGATYEYKYSNETASKVGVWPRLVLLSKRLGFGCLTSHAVHSDRPIEK